MRCAMGGVCVDGQVDVRCVCTVRAQVCVVLVRVVCYDGMMSGCEVCAYAGWVVSRQVQVRCGMGCGVCVCVCVVR